MANFTDKCTNSHCASVIAVYKNINHELSTKVTELKMRVQDALTENNDLNRRLLLERAENQKLRAGVIGYVSAASGSLLRLQQQFCPIETAELQSPRLNSTSPMVNQRWNTQPRSAQSIGKVQPIVKVPGGHIQSLTVNLSRLAPNDSIDLINRELEPASTSTANSRSNRFHSTRISGSPADSTLTSFEFDDTIPTEETNIEISVPDAPNQNPPPADTDYLQLPRSSENMAVLSTIIEEVGTQLSTMSGTIAASCSAVANKENTIVSTDGYNILTSSICSATCSTPYKKRVTSNMQMIRSFDVRVVLSPLKVEEITKYKRKLNVEDDGDSDDVDDGATSEEAEDSGSKKRSCSSRRQPAKRKSTGRPKRKAAPKELIEVNLRKKLRRPKKDS